MLNVGRRKQRQNVSGKAKRRVIAHFESETEKCGSLELVSLLGLVIVSPQSIFWKNLSNVRFEFLGVTLDEPLVFDCVYSA